MNYEIVTQRWPCPECGGPIRLHLSQVAATQDDEPLDEWIMDRIFCGMGHTLPDEMLTEIRPYAYGEFNSAIENGAKVAEIWCAPNETEEDSTSPNENVPPED